MCIFVGCSADVVEVLREHCVSWFGSTVGGSVGRHCVPARKVICMCGGARSRVCLKFAIVDLAEC